MYITLPFQYLNQERFSFSSWFSFRYLNLLFSGNLQHSMVNSFFCSFSGWRATLKSSLFLPPIFCNLPFQNKSGTSILMERSSLLSQSRSSCGRKHLHTFPSQTSLSGCSQSTALLSHPSTQQAIHNGRSYLGTQSSRWFPWNPSRFRKRWRRCKEAAYCPLWRNAIPWEATLGRRTSFMRRALYWWRRSCW